MRLFSSPSIREFWRDRGALPVTQFGDIAIPSGGGANSYLYVVTASRVLLVEHVHLSIRLASTIPFGLFVDVIQLVLASGGAQIYRAVFRFGSGVGPGLFDCPLPGNFQLRAGQTFQARATASVTYGDATLNASFAGVEFDV